ncbi:MAG: hypothetical protein L0Z62_47695 [Gemmataceae bacterium]|nr:hypothetical protein [Gemmataceae bacterium]
MVSTLLIEEIAQGHGLYLSRAAKRFPPHRKNRPVTLGCLVRWIIEGVRGPGGERVRLEAARVAGKWMTTPQAITRFIIAQTPDLADRPQLPRTSTMRRRAAERAEAQLQKIGL